MKHKSYLTAIARRSLPSPTRWLLKQKLIDAQALVLDYGCGKCALVNPKAWLNFDPHYAPDTLKTKAGLYFSTIICNYVLCTLPKEERTRVLLEIQALLTSTGEAFISVRNDKPKQGWGLSTKGTYQGRCSNVTDDLVYKNSQFRIYRLTKKTRIA